MSNFNHDCYRTNNQKEDINQIAIIDNEDKEPSSNKKHYYFKYEIAHDLCFLVLVNS